MDIYDRYTEKEKEALNYFCDAYMNTGCEEEEAIAYSENMLSEYRGDTEKLRIEAHRYLDM